MQMHYSVFISISCFFSAITCYGQTPNTSIINISVQQGVSPLLLNPFGENERAAFIAFAKNIGVSVQQWYFPLSCAALGFGYMLMWMDIQKGCALVNNPDAWCCWKQHCTLEYLAQQAQRELSDNLLVTIHERYINMEDPTNSSASLAIFLPALNQEIAQLERLQCWITRLLTYRCAFLFSVDKKLEEQASAALKRLYFVKKLFVQWLASHNAKIHINSEPITRSGHYCPIHTYKCCPVHSYPKL